MTAPTPITGRQGPSCHDAVTTTCLLCPPACDAPVAISDLIEEAKP